MSTKGKTNKLYIRGTARFPRLDQPYKFDMAKQKTVPDPEGKLEVQVIVDADAASPFIEQIEEFAKANGVKKMKNAPYTEELDRETGEETGRYIFKAWQYGKTKNGANRKMPHVDARGVPIKDDDFQLTTGSEIVIACRPNAFTQLGGGVNLYLDAVQVISLMERSSDFGFDAVEDGDFVQDDDHGEDEAADYGFDPEYEEGEDVTGDGSTEKAKSNKKSKATTTSTDF